VLSALLYVFCDRKPQTLKPKAEGRSSKT